MQQYTVLSIQYRTDNYVKWENTGRATFVQKRSGEVRHGQRGQALLIWGDRVLCIVTRGGVKSTQRVTLCLLCGSVLLFVGRCCLRD